MYPPNLFHDICLEPTPFNATLKRMKLTKVSLEKQNFFQNLSIVNFDCKHAHKNKIQLTFFKYIINFYEQDSVTVLDVLKQQHYQTLIIINNEDKFVGGAALYFESNRGIFHILSSHQ